MPTMTHNMRDVAIREIGCICCLKRGLGYMPATKHHQLSTGRHGTGKRKGESFTCGLCQYHHQGYQYSGLQPIYTRAQALERFGPSYADSARLFRQEFGDDATLLAEQDRLIAVWRESFVV